MRILGAANRQPIMPQIGPRTVTAGLMKKYGIPSFSQLSKGWNMWKQMFRVMRVSRAKKIEKPRKYW